MVADGRRSAAERLRWRWRKCRGCATGGSDAAAAGGPCAAFARAATAGPFATPASTATPTS
ncbi:hypothetical protein D621_14960, partial [beta proteobacterium AAP51]